MKSILAGFITASSHNPAFAGSAHEQRFPFQRGVVDAFHRHKECVQVEMGDITLGLRHAIAKIRHKNTRITPSRRSRRRRDTEYLYLRMKFLASPCLVL